MIDETYNEVWKLLNNIPLRDYLKIPKKEISEILKNKIYCNTAAELFPAAFFSFLFFKHIEFDIKNLKLRKEKAK